MTDDRANTHHVVVARELLPKLQEWSPPVQIRVVAEFPDGELSLELRDHPPAP